MWIVLDINGVELGEFHEKRDAEEFANKCLFEEVFLVFDKDRE